LQTALYTVYTDMLECYKQIQHIEKDVRELGQLFNIELDLVVNQESAVISIEENRGEVLQKLETAIESLDQANLSTKGFWYSRKYRYIVSSKYEISLSRAS
jgi:t-SNARE complex subunit (syntaxin)